MAIVLRIDGDATIGFGHVVRSIALGETLRDRFGLSCEVWTRSTLGALPFPTRAISPTLPVADEGQLLDDRRPAPEIVVADLFDPTAEQLAGYAAGPWRLACIDDQSPLEFDCDLLVSPNLDGTFRHRRTRRAAYLSGAGAILLRAQFEALPAHPVAEHPRNVIVCLGGGDGSGGVERLVGTLRERLPAGVERVSVVVGRGYTNVDALRAQCALDERFVVRQDVSDMAAALRDADLGILAAGTLLYEAMACGLPALMVSLTATQAREAEAAAELGATIHLGALEALTVERLVEGVQQLLAPDARRRVSIHAQRIVDGWGCERVAERIGALIARRAGG